LQNNVILKSSSNAAGMDGTHRYFISNSGPKNSCHVIHPHTSCTMEMIIKCATVLKKSTRLYVALYIAMFALQFKKMKR